MKNSDRKKVKELGLEPLLSLEDLKDNREVYGIGWNGKFQKGIVDSKGVFVHFEQEYGGVKEVEKRKGIIEWRGKLVFPLKTIHSELYIKK